MPPPTRERHEHNLGRSADDVEHDCPAFVAGGDVEKHKFIGPFGFVARSDFDRIAGIAEVEELGSLHHSTAIDIQTGNNSFGEHFLQCMGSLASRCSGNRRRGNSAAKKDRMVP